MMNSFLRWARVGCGVFCTVFTLALSFGFLTTPAHAKSAKSTQFIKKDIKKGTGKLAEKGNLITVHYTGKLTNGKKFDSSVDRGVPFKFVLGAGQVIKGWDEGFDGMKVGGKRQLTIPPEMGYGDRSAGEIPPNSTLIFDVELLDVQKLEQNAR